MSSADDLESLTRIRLAPPDNPSASRRSGSFRTRAERVGARPRVLRRVAGSEDQRRTRPQRSPRRTDCHADASAPGSRGGAAKEPAAWPANPPVSKHHHSRGSFPLSGRCRRPRRQRGMAEIVAALVHGSTLYATTIAAGLLMVRLGSIMRQVESKTGPVGAPPATDASPDAAADAHASRETSAHGRPGASRNGETGPPKSQVLNTRPAT
jgi:hypothetical protein